MREIKKGCLNFLKERKQDKIQGWRNRLLNNVEKEVLIKAVITSIPTYAMNDFGLTSIWCAEINAMISTFWWGQ